MSIKVQRPAMTPRQEQQVNQLPADLERLEGLLEYTAMMADVELPESEETEEGEDE